MSNLSKENVTIGLTLAGAMTPAGLGISTIIPLVKAGYIDYLISTGANLYHDLHFALKYPLYESFTTQHDDKKLHKKGIIRIYDILFSADTLYDTDAFIRSLLKATPFQKTMSTSEFHYLIGKAVAQVEEELETTDSSILASCYRNNVPIYTSSPGDSTFGLNLAALQLKNESKCKIDPNLDVNETAAIVWDTVSKGEENAVIIIGGGSPKNFILQTGPHLQEILGLNIANGHDYFIQFTDSHPDTGGLSGATPSEALTWGKIDPDHLQRSIIVYGDSTINVPLWTSYILEHNKKKKLKEYYPRLSSLIAELRSSAKKTTPPVENHALGDKIREKLH